ncbi:MAG TPA: hypothetical protein VGG84_04125, partial [Gemmatimonadaceae bacterium]
GLAISQWIAQAHDGRIAVQSRLGRGSVFTVSLPLMSTAQVEAADQAKRELREQRDARDADLGDEPATEVRGAAARRVHDMRE